MMIDVAEATDQSRPAVRPALHVAIIGLGWIGKAHVAELSARSDIRLVAVADRDYELANGVAPQHGARAYPDAGSLLDSETLNALWVCTPPAHHREAAIMALERG